MGKLEFFLHLRIDTLKLCDGVVDMVIWIKVYWESFSIVTAELVDIRSEDIGILGKLLYCYS